MKPRKEILRWRKPLQSTEVMLQTRSQSEVAQTQTRSQSEVAQTQSSHKSTLKNILPRYHTQTPLELIHRRQIAKAKAQMYRRDKSHYGFCVIWVCINSSYGHERRKGKGHREIKLKPTRGAKFQL